MQIPINKDIRRYQEEIFMGLTLRQLLCSGIAIGLAVLIYLWAKPLLGAGNRQLVVYPCRGTHCRRGIFKL